MAKETKQDYYVKAFKNLDEGKNTWNWAACFGGIFWMLFKKMYLYAFLFCVVNGLIIVGSLALGPKGVLPFAVIGIYFLVTQIIYGFFGNALFYRIVKKKIAKGYHLLNKYHHESMSIVIISLSTYGIFGLLMSSFYSFSDWLARKIYFGNHELGNTEINEKNIRLYLSDSSKEHTTGIIVKMLAVVFFIVAFIIMGQVGDKSNEWLYQTELFQEARSSGLLEE